MIVDVFVAFVAVVVIFDYLFFYLLGESIIIFECVSDIGCMIDIGDVGRVC